MGYCNSWKSYPPCHIQSDRRRISTVSGKLAGSGWPGRITVHPYRELCYQCFVLECITPNATYVIHSLSVNCDTHCRLIGKTGKGFQYSLPSIGPRSDPGVQAVSLKVTIRHPRGGRLPLLSARPAVTFPATQHHRPLAGTKLYCSVTEAHTCEQLAQVCYAAFAPSRIWTHDQLITSPALYSLCHRTTCSLIRCHKSIEYWMALLQQ